VIVRVILPPRVETAFKKAAVAAFPREHAEAMRGRVVGDTVTITRFVPIPHATATPDTVEFLHDDAITKKDGTDAFVGTCHSHPGEGCDAAPSVADWKSAFDCGEIVSGIVVVERGGNGKLRAGRIHFYESRPPIAVVHPRVRAPRKKRVEIPLRDINTEIKFSVEEIQSTEPSTNVHEIPS